MVVFTCNLYCAGNHTEVVESHRLLPVLPVPGSQQELNTEAIYRNRHKLILLVTLLVWSRPWSWPWLWPWPTLMYLSLAWTVVQERRRRDQGRTAHVTRNPTVYKAQKAEKRINRYRLQKVYFPSFEPRHLIFLTDILIVIPSKLINILDGIFNINDFFS